MALDVESLYRAFGPMVLRRCRKLLRDETKAVDAMHDVFVEILRRKETLHDEAPAGLLLQTATNVCLNRIRDRGRRPVTDEEGRLATIAASDEPGAGSHARLLLARLFGQHPESSRTMAVLHFVDGLTLEQVAEETGMSVSGVRKRLRRLRETLRGDAR